MLTLEWASISHLSQAYISNSPPLPGLAATLGHVCLLVWKSAFRDCASPAWCGAWHRQVLSTGSKLEWTGAPATLCTCPSPLLAECPPAGRTQQVVPFIQQVAIPHPIHVGHTLDAGRATWALVQPLPEGGLQPGGVQVDCREQKGDKGSRSGLGRSRAMLEPRTGPRSRPVALCTFLCCFPAGPVPAARPRVKLETSWTSSSRR